MAEPSLYPIPLHYAQPALPKYKYISKKFTEEGFVTEFKVDIDENEWINTVREKVNEARPKVHHDQPCTIFRVPESIKHGGGAVNSFYPTVATIGPYNYFPEQSGTGRAMHEHKWRCVRYLLSRHKSQESASQLLDQCLMALKALDGDVRNCYAGELNSFDPPKLASVMLMDGCFIIRLLLMQVENESFDSEVEEESNKEEVKGKEKVMEVELEMGKEEEKIGGPLIGMLWLWKLVIFDLLKVENQIPFFIIQTIFDIIRTPRDKNLVLVDLALHLFRGIHPYASKSFTKLPASQIHHLLHLFHTSLVPYKYKSIAPISRKWIPSAMELKRTGIKLVKKETSESFLDITYNDGVLQIPTLQVYDYSNSLFQNLIVYEQSFPDVGKYIMNYAAFMQCIVAAEEDAKLLDSKEILVNRVGTDEVLANLFNCRKNHLHYASDGNYLADIFTNVKKDHESKWRRWRAGLARVYFSNYWTGVTILFTVLLLLLVIEQSFFAAFSYFRSLYKV
ncbi:UPF0481 protein At3g47200-like [Asparagus officinalis]|uniref:UPF0481 protein At3g47200-like n=1 Tax=Asparagus officinalis TaxID=4686 RepID=UPI00098E024B|nr:UPF0481 protein At3g47200-like [Asparagus officinalis]